MERMLNAEATPAPPITPCEIKQSAGSGAGAIRKNSAIAQSNTRPPQ